MVALAYELSSDALMIAYQSGQIDVLVGSQVVDAGVYLLSSTTTGGQETYVGKLVVVP